MKRLSTTHVRRGYRYLLSCLFACCLTFMANAAGLTSKVHSPGPVSGEADKIRLQLRAVYTSQVGVREKGNNAGQAVESYLQYVGLEAGQPWCAAFVCWALGQAGVANPKSGWSPRLFPDSKVIWSKARGAESEKGKAQSPRARPYPSSLTPGNRPLAPQPGDIFGIHFPEKGRIAHVGFVDDWGAKWVTTVEGNTNILGSREGDGVYRKRRLVSSLYQVAGYIGR